jgi:divalent metal cation (Fe/Co/Zn/Cd) transporter
VLPPDSAWLGGTVSSISTPLPHHRRRFALKRSPLASRRYCADVPPAQANRSILTALALRLSWASVAWAAVSGTASLAVGVLDHSLAITGVGLNLLGDLAGSLALIWRFRRERSTGGAETPERVARMVVGTALTLIAAFLAVQSVRRLADGTRPIAAVGPLLLAAASVLVLPPLARAKRRVGTQLDSRALHGDGTLSGVGAAIALLALAGLLVNRMLGWWWADPGAALVVAVTALVEARAVFAAAP